MREETINEVIEVHHDLITNFSEPDYVITELSYNILSQNALESCINTPQGTSFGTVLYPSIIEMASSYSFLLAKNHSFQDGNKRTAFAIMGGFIRDNLVDFTFDLDRWKYILNTVTDRIEIKDALLEDIGFDEIVELD